MEFGQALQILASTPGKRLSLLLTLLQLPAPVAQAGANYDYRDVIVDQKTAQATAAVINGAGKDDSHDEGVRNAMRALNSLASLNIPGAFHYGYKGYGNYINMQKLRNLRTSTRNLSYSMDSVSDNLASKSASGVTGESDRMSDHDTAFLYQGETNEVAEEFEKRSGMKREEFYKHLATIHDSNLSWDDPQVLNKLEAHYQILMERIPNKDYRTNVAKAHSLLDLTKKFDLLGELKEFYVKNRFGGEEGAKEPKLAQSAPMGGASASAPLAGVASAEGAPIDNTRAPASLAHAAATLKKDEMGLYLGLEGSQQENALTLTDFTQSAGLSPDSESIFNVVSKRYRKLTPMLLGKAAMVLESK